MINYNVKQTKIYHEFSDSYNLNFFDRVREKYLHNIDTLYYTTTIFYDEWIYNNVFETPEFEGFREYLILKKQEALKTFESLHLIEIPGNFYISPISFGLYNYCIEKKGEYMIFIADHQVSDSTPQILIQLRSEFLWLKGEHQATNSSFEDLKYILSFFSLYTGSATENRIDFAYHTNYIQDPLSFFREDKLNSMQVSNFTRWSKQGAFVGSDDITCDYLSLGRRKSNNTFVRIYNKTQEVLDQGYKQFFFKIWLCNNLINRFDYYVLEKSFLAGGYLHVDRSRLSFYLEYGNDFNIKSEINYLLKGHDNEAIKKLADKIVPKLTLVCNIEIQTKRKFYASMDNSINLLDTRTFKHIELKRLFKIYDNKDLFHTFITTHVIRFVDRSSHSRKTNCETSSWWQRLQNIELYQSVKYGLFRELIREYQRDLDIIRMKKDILNKLSTFSIYQKNMNDDSSNKDIVDFMSYLNETDIEEASRYKQKKSTILKGQLENLSKPVIVSRFSLIDNKTAEFLD